MLVLGAGGLLGRQLLTAGARGSSRQQLDITDRDAVRRALDQGPSAVINAAAQARVDAAEEQVEWTWEVNHRAVEDLARECAQREVRLVHIGTDYSLRDDGDLVPAMQPAPVGVYAASKSAGEQAALAHGAVVVRVQWVYHPGHASFFTRVLQAVARGETVRLVTDQVGVPTPAALLAPALLKAAQGGPAGLYHLACQGQTSAWGWIAAAAELLGLPLRAQGITRSQLGGVERPARSVLDSSSFAADFGERLPDWRVALEQVLRQTGWQPRG